MCSMVMRSDSKVSRFTDDQVLMTARLYYVDGMAQADVARVMKISQPQVSRILNVAKEKGFVRVTVADYDPRDHELEQALEQKLKLKRCLVIKTVKGTDSSELREAVAHFAAPYLAETVQQAKTVAVAGGRTLRDIVKILKAPRRSTGITFVQAMGNIGSIPVNYDGIELGRMLANEWHGAFYMLNTPIYLPNAATRNAIMNVGDNLSVARRLGRADLALVGVGTCYNSVFVERGSLHEKELKQIFKSGAVGEICGRFYDVEGKEIDSPLKDTVASIQFEQLRRIPQVIAITVGADRSAAILAATKGGLIKSLIIDDAGARALIDLVNEE